jgi:hypothetical protein
MVVTGGRRRIVRKYEIVGIGALTGSNSEAIGELLAVKGRKKFDELNRPIGVGIDLVDVPLME